MRPSDRSMRRTGLHSSTKPMRSAEWINLVYFLSLSLIGLRVAVSPRRRAILALGTGGILMALLGPSSTVFLDAQMSGLVRDWLPGPTLLVAYAQASRFFASPAPRLQARLRSLDDRVGALLGRTKVWFEHRAFGLCLEAVYMMAYPMVPGGLGVLWLLGLRDRADQFWVLVLVPCYACYALLPFAPTLPPRLDRPRGAAGPGMPSPLRRLNLWLIGRFGSGANTFPSGHVAAATATALVVLEADFWLGAGFSFLGAGIAVSAVARRYHYVADVVLGALLALAVRLVVTA
jgi:membrane-associated phospholipid phosphatase